MESNCPQLLTRQENRAKVFDVSEAKGEHGAAIVSWRQGCCRQGGAFFAGMFHRALLLYHSPDSVETYIDFQAAKENYLCGRTDDDPWLPDHVREALAVEPPSGLQ